METYLAKEDLLKLQISWGGLLSGLVQNKPKLLAQ